ncbi:MAG: hypothetical protein N3E40_05765, partial [Dehalococcoidia bacterium]|nr:hypothetical protein [Dehalococcoidia bacterium]
LYADPPVCYAGSLIALDFSDEDQDKGFYIVELKSGSRPGSRLSHPPEFTKVKTRRFITIKVNIVPNDPNPMSTVISAIDSQLGSIKDAIVKVEITVPETRIKFLNDRKILDACRNAHNVTLARHVTRELRPRLDIPNAEQLTPVQALKAYLEHRNDLSSSRRQILLGYGEKLINEALYLTGPEPS